jgi:hypothetical protein
MNPSITNAGSQPKPRKYTRRSKAQWQELITNFKHSDLTLEAYCQQHRIAPSGFYSWRKRFESELTPEKLTDALIDITQPLKTQATAMDTDKKTWQIELELSTGCVLRIKTA